MDAGIQRGEWMSKNAPELPALGRISSNYRGGQLQGNWLTVVALSMLFVAPAIFAQVNSSSGFARIPAETAFDSEVMPFISATPLRPYGAMGTAPWVTLEFAGQSRGKAYLEVGTLRLYATAPSDPNPPLRNTQDQAEAAQRQLTAQEVRLLWTNRRVLSGWLDFSSVTENLRQKLESQGRLPIAARVQALVDEMYAEVTTRQDDSTTVTLKTHRGRTITPDAPHPTWVEPLFHQVFIACIGASPKVPPPLSIDVLGKRYEARRRCGLMNAQGHWLAKPEFEFMEQIDGSMAYGRDGPLLLLLRGEEPCVSTMHLPVVVSCLGQPLSSLFSNDRLAFAVENSDSQRRGGQAIGYVAQTGGWAIPPTFYEAQPYSGKVATVQRKGAPGVIERSGRWVTPEPPDEPEAARWLALMAVGPDFLYGSGLIDRDGNTIIPTIFPSVEREDKTHYRVCHQNGCDDIQVPIAPKSPSAKPIKSIVSAKVIPLAAQWVPAAENGKWGFKSTQEYWVIKPQFDAAEPFINGLAQVRIGELWGVIMPSGKWLYQPEFRAISPLFNGVAIGESVDGRNVLLRADGRSIPFDDRTVLSPFSEDGLAIAGRQGRDKIGFINQDGEWVVQPSYNHAKPFEGHYAVVSGHIPSNWRPTGLKEPPYILRSVHWLSSDVIALRAWVGKEERLGLMDKNGNWLLPSNEILQNDAAF